MRILRVCAPLGTALVLAGCNDNSGDWCDPCWAPGISGYSGSVSGLASGTSVVLQDNLGATTTVSNGSFTLATSAGPGFPALLGILVQPAGQDCTLSSGTPDGNGVVPVAIACGTASAAPAVLSDLAGMQTAGSANATGLSASFNGPNGIASDSAGNLYLADTGNHTIRMITPAGVVSTLAGTAGVAGSNDGTGAAAGFRAPNAVAVDATGNVYVADTGNNTIRKIASGGVVTTLAGTAGAAGSADGTGAAAQFAAPAGIAIDASGNVLVADYYNATIRRITPAGAVTTLAGAPGAYGWMDGSGSVARFYGPQGLATDASGNAYVADSGNNTIRLVTPAGVVTTVAGTPGTWGSADGTGSAATFNQPVAVTVSAAGVVYVADSENDTIRRIASGGAVSTVVGIPGHDVFSAGPLPASLQEPQGVAVVGSSLYVVTSGGVAAVSSVP